MQIKSVVIDHIHYINFITFNISTLFFFYLPNWNWGASYTSVRLICRQTVLEMILSLVLHRDTWEYLTVWKLFVLKRIYSYHKTLQNIVRTRLNKKCKYGYDSQNYRHKSWLVDMPLKSITQSCSLLLNIINRNYSTWLILGVSSLCNG